MNHTSPYLTGKTKLCFSLFLWLTYPQKDVVRTGGGGQINWFKIVRNNNYFSQEALLLRGFRWYLLGCFLKRLKFKKYHVFNSMYPSSSSNSKQLLKQRAVSMFECLPFKIVSMFVKCLPFNCWGIWMLLSSLASHTALRTSRTTIWSVKWEGPWRLVVHKPHRRPFFRTVPTTS